MTLVYSTECGRIKEEKTQPERPKGDGIVRIQRQTKGRKGKGVCVVTGLDVEDTQLKLIAAELKKCVVVVVLLKMAQSKFRAISVMCSKLLLRRRATQSNWLAVNHNI